MRRPEAWATITAIAEGQWGMVTTAQAEVAGVGFLVLSRFAARGDLERMTHGVYRVRGSAPVSFPELRAAWLHLAPRLLADQRYAHPELGVVSHGSAARLHQLGDLLGDQHEFTTTARRRTRRADVHIWRATVPDTDLTITDGLPVTTPTRTILDLLSIGEDGGHVATVLSDAQRTQRLDLATLARRADAYAGSYGATTGRELLDLLLSHNGPHATTDEK